MYFDIDLKLLSGKKYSKSKQTKYSGFVKLGVRSAERDNGRENKNRLTNSWDVFTNFSQFEQLKRKQTSCWCQTLFSLSCPSCKQNHNNIR